MGKIITFYSYKGGVGRTMALANIGCLLSKWGKKVLLVDFDLDAPGLESYFDEYSSSVRKVDSKCNGVLDLITYSIHAEKKKWKDAILKYTIPKHGIDIDILPSGNKSNNYTEIVQNIDWEKLFSEYNLGLYLETLRNEWKANYDFILIDSRTGLTDIGGICTIYLPDIITFLFTTNNTSLNGCINIIERVKLARDKVPFDRDFLITLPLPSRDESRTENILSQEWHKKFSEKLNVFYKDWLPNDTPSSEVVDLLRIPYIPIWSFGDRLPVIEEGTTKIDSIGYIYEKVAKLIFNEFEWSKVNETILIQEKIKDPKKETTMESEKYIEERVDKQIYWYGIKSRRNKSLFYGLTTTQILIAALLPLFANIKYESFSQLKDIIISASGILIVIIAGLLSIGKYKEKWLNYRKTTELIKKEKYKFLTNSFPYEEIDSYKNFVKNIEEKFSDENMEWEKTINNIKLENYK